MEACHVTLLYSITEIVFTNSYNQRHFTIKRCLCYS